MRLTGQTVIRMVRDHYNLTEREMTGDRRLRFIARPRQVAMYLIRRHCPHLSMPQIGTMLGGRDHTTILHGIRKIEELLALDPVLAGDVHFLSRKISALAPDTLWQARIIAAERHLTALYLAQAEDAPRVGA